MIRRFGESPEPGRKYTRRPGAYVLLPRGDSLLLTWYDDGLNPELQLPGGGIDPGESPIRALHREVYEETGWLIADPKHFGTFRRFVYMPEYGLWAEKICMIFRARPVRRMGPPAEQFHEALWMNCHDAVGRLDNTGDQHFARLHSQGF